MPARLLVLVSTGAVILSGCPGAIEDPAPFLMFEGSTCPDTYDVERDLFAGTCGQLACHSGGPALAASGLDLASPGIGPRIMAHRSEDCGGRALVDPGDLDGSYLLQKIDHEMPACGDRMPSGLEPLSGLERACLRDYLAALAGSIDGGVPIPELDAGAPVEVLEPITIEAEAMTLEGYVVDAAYPDAIRLPDAVPTGTAAHELARTGSYTLRVFALREPDGQPTLTIRVGGVVVAGETFALGAAEVEPMVLGPYEVDVEAGDSIVLEGAANEGAWARVDRVELTP
jgi:hypothetical protein